MGNGNHLRCEQQRHSLARAPQKVAPKMVRGMAQTRMYINIYLNEINILH